jgi:hypothetical protein
MKNRAIIVVAVTSLAIFANSSSAAILPIVDTLNEQGPGSTVSILGVPAPFTPFGTPGSSYYYATAGEFGVGQPPTLTYFDNTPIPFNGVPGSSASVVLAGTGGAVATFGSQPAVSETYAYWDYVEFFPAGALSTAGLPVVPIDYIPNTSGEAGYVPGYLVAYDFVPVPEPSSLIAGALMLLPFGASALRVLRRQQAA